MQSLPESDRRTIFAELVALQDARLSVRDSRRHVREKYSLTDAQLRRIEEEGCDEEWPPLGPADTNG